MANLRALRVRSEVEPAWLVGDGAHGVADGVAAFVATEHERAVVAPQKVDERWLVGHRQRSQGSGGDSSIGRRLRSCQQIYRRVQLRDAREDRFHHERPYGG